MNADTGWCEGCLRTIDEIAGWSSMDDAQKRAVWQAIARRRDPLPQFSKPKSQQRA
jgi:uncharacterized protein